MKNQSIKSVLLVLLTMLSTTAFSKESITTTLTVGATVVYQCQVPSNDERVAEMCSKQLPPKVDTDSKYLIHTY